MPGMTERKKPQRKGEPLGVYITPELYAAFDSYIEATEPRTSKTAIISMLLRRFLEEQGHWPPPPAPKKG